MLTIGYNKYNTNCDFQVKEKPIISLLNKPNNFSFSADTQKNRCFQDVINDAASTQIENG